MTAQWLSEQLGEPISAFTIEKVGAGNTSDAHKISYGEGKTVILKLPSGLGEAKQKIHAKDCTTEVMFYQDFAPKLAGTLKLPKVFVANSWSAEPHRWNILMEDLSSGNFEEFPTALLFGKHAVSDVLEVTLTALGELARMHGKFWGNEQLFEHPIFSVQDPLGPGAKVTNGFISLGTTVWRPDFRGTGKSANLVLIDLIDKYGSPDNDVLKCEDLWSPGCKYYEFLKTLHTPKMQEAVAYMVEHFDSRPHTLLHGDAHIGNVFFDRSGGEFTWIDFQFFGRGPPGVDMAMATCDLEAEDHDQALRHYYSELIKAGPPGLAEQYSFGDLWQDWRYMMLAMLLCITAAYFPDIVPSVGEAAIAAGKEDDAHKGWRIFGARWGANWDLADVYAVPDELLELKAKANSINQARKE